MVDQKQIVTCLNFKTKGTVTVQSTLNVPLYPCDCITNNISSSSVYILGYYIGTSFRVYRRFDSYMDAREYIYNENLIDKYPDISIYLIDSSIKKF